MQRRIFFGLLVFCLFSIVGGAQNPPDIEKTVWPMEIIKVKPRKVGTTLGYLGDNWMREREKRQGCRQGYHRIVNRIPGRQANIVC